MYKYINLDHSVVELGQSVSGQICLRSEKLIYAHFSVQCVCSVEGRVGSKSNTVSNIKLGKHSFGDTIPFLLDLPSAAPVSFNGKLFRVTWNVVVTIKEGMLRSNETCAPFLVVPMRSPLLNS